MKGNIHIKPDKTSNIKIRLIHKSVPQYFSTDLYVQPEKLIKGWVTGKNSAFINSRIKDELDKYTTRYLKLGAAAVNKMTAKQLRDRLMADEEDTEIDFLKFADEYYQELKEEKKDGSARALQGFIKNIKSFKEDVMFSDIDLNFLKEFQKYMKKEGVGNSINNYMRYFRLVFNRGRDKFNDEDRGIIRIPNYPFRKLKIAKTEVKTREHSLTLDQLRSLINYKSSKPREQMAKDMFLLMFYLIGINTKDLYGLQKPDKDGRVAYSRAKTKRKYSIKVESEALAVIEGYAGDNLLLNIAKVYKNYLDWQKYLNIELKVIGATILSELRKSDPQAVFPTDISTNWARHTWATIARNDCRINKDDIALCLGHEDSDNKVTDIYIRYDYSIIDESNRKVLDLIFGKQTEPKNKDKASVAGKKKSKGNNADTKQKKSRDEDQYLLFRDISFK